MSNNSTIRFISIALIFMASNFAFVSAGNEVQFILNNGFPSSSGASCSSTEHSRISAVFSNRRALRGSDNSIDNSTSVEGLRELTTLRECLNICQFYPTNACHKRGCTRSRDLVADEENDRNLQVSCTNDINNMHARLDSVMASVSTSCKNFMARDRRRANCFPDYVYGTVLGIRVWRISGSNQFLHTNFVAPGGTARFCKSMYFNIETLVEPCVQSVAYEMWGPNVQRSHSEVEAPFSLYGDDGKVLKGKQLSTAGGYDVWMAPDHDWNKAQYFQIILDNC